MNTLKWLATAFVLVILCADNLTAQLTAMYNENQSALIVQNNREEVCYIFRKDIPADIDGTRYFDSYNIAIENENLLFFSCLKVKQNFVKILPGQKEVFQITSNCNATHLYYYPCVNNAVDLCATVEIVSQVEQKKASEGIVQESPKQESLQQDIPKSETPTQETQKLETPKLEIPDLKEETSIKEQSDFDELIRQLSQIAANKTPSTESTVRDKKDKSKQNKPEKKQTGPKQSEIFDMIQNQYQRLNSECRPLLQRNKVMQPANKIRLDRKQRDLNKLKTQLENIVPIDASHAEVKNNIITKIRSLIQNIAEVTIANSKTIKEDYKEIYDKHIARISDLQKQSTKIEAIVNKKINESVLTRWIKKESVVLVINSLKEGVVFSENDFESDKMQFVEKWKKEEKEQLENLLIRQNDELKDGYNKLKYSISLYEKRIEDLRPPYVMIILLFLVILLLIIAVTFYVRAYYKSKKMEKRNSKMMKDSIISIDDEQELPFYYETGLDEIRDEIGEYFVVGMETIFSDTAIEKVYISRNCILSIYKFFMEFLKLKGKTNETGCFVIGRWEAVTPNSYNISLEEIIEPGSDAVYGEYELDFGTQIGIGLEGAIINMRQSTQKDYIQTSWIHSHPGLGLFLSNHDLIVQSQLVYSDHPTRMLAIVIDSNTENLDTAFFTSKKSGNMNNKEDMKKILSFEEIVQWAKGILPEPLLSMPFEEIKEEMNKESVDFDIADYYEYAANSPNSIIETFLFNGSTIIDMDSVISPNIEGLQGYFYGRLLPEPRRKLLLEHFQTTKTEEKGEAIGCLLVLPQFTYQSVLVRYESIIDRYDFFVVYNPRQDDLKIITRSQNGKYLIGAERDLFSLSMMELRKWTRRKRD